MGDRVILVYTNNSNDLKFPLFDKISELDIPIQFLKCVCGSTNALDFQLVSYLGYLIHDDPSQTYYIVTNDAGYDSVISFWRNRGVDILRIMWPKDGCMETISGEAGLVAVRSDVLHAFGGTRNLKPDVEKLLPEEYAGELDTICSMFEQVSKHTRRSHRSIAFRNALTKAYGLHNGSMLYACLREYTAPAFKSAPDITSDSPDKSVHFGSDSAGRFDIKPPDEETAPAPDGPSDPSGKTYTWDEYTGYVCSQQVCAAYIRSLVHDFTEIDENLAKFIMTCMAYAMSAIPKDQRNSRVLAAVSLRLPKKFQKKALDNLKGRLQRKMSSGVWPDSVLRKLNVTGCPSGL